MKSKLRKQGSLRRSNLSKKQISKKSKTITKKLQDMKEYKNAKKIMFYVSYDNEVKTHEIIKKELENRNKKIIVPITKEKKKQLLPVKLEKWNELKPKTYGILEPEEKEIEDLDKIDLVIVPGVVFDGQGCRIGHGLGYYDRLLCKVRNSVNIGLAFELQVVEKVPTNEYDVSLDKIVTEKRIINCKERI